MSKVLRLTKNVNGTDYWIGDIHGCFDAVEAELERAGFDKNKDRLLSVGDLTDRGPQSYRATEFLQEPWFFALMGNHDAFVARTAQRMAQGLFDSNSVDVNTCLGNGGSWIVMQTDDDIKEIATLMSHLPIAIEYVDTDGTLIAGMVHAELDKGQSWQDLTEYLTTLSDDFVYSLDNEDDYPRILNAALWGRSKHKKYKVNVAIGDQDTSWGMSDGVPLLICGHNVVAQQNDGPVKIANNRLIDHGIVKNQSAKVAIYTFEQLVA